MERSIERNITSPKIYVKALPLRVLTDLEVLKEEVAAGHVLIVKITPIVKRSSEEAKSAINDLVEFVKGMGGDIARLGEERIVITPPSVKIWRGEREPMRFAVGSGQEAVREARI